MGEFLIHHGIKGQKWGVRRTPEQLGYKVGKDYIKISAESQNAKGGVSHVSVKKRVKPNKNSRIYVYDQTNARDKEVYEGAYSEYLTRRNRGKKIFSNKYNLNSDIYAATQKAQEKRFSELYKNDEDVKRVTDIVQAYLNRIGWYNNESVKKNAGKRFDDPNYRKFLAFNSEAAWGAKHPEIANVVDKYIDSFSKEGFNALIDANNAKIYNGADAPLIIINGRESLKRTGVNNVPMSVVNANVEAIKKRQGGSIALAEEDYGSIKFVDMDDYLSHHGIKGMHWGIRRTPEQLGHKKIKKMLSGESKVNLPIGTKLYRISASNESDSKYQMLYVSADKTESELYMGVVGLGNALRAKGKMYQQQYETTKEIKIPSVKEQSRLELSLLDNPKIKGEIVKSLASKGRLPDNVYKQLDKPNLAKTILASIVAAPTIIHPGMFLMVENGIIRAYKNKKESRKAAIRVGFGDHAIEETRKEVIRIFNEAGYNAIRDTNDKYNGVKAKHAIILLNNDTTKTNTIHEISKNDYAESRLHLYRSEKYKNTPISKLTDSEIKENAERAYALAEEAYKKKSTKKN